MGPSPGGFCWSESFTAGGGGTGERRGRGPAVVPRLRHPGHATAGPLYPLMSQFKVKTFRTLIMIADSFSRMGAETVHDHGTAWSEGAALSSWQCVSATSMEHRCRYRGAGRVAGVATGTDAAAGTRITATSAIENR